MATNTHTARMKGFIRAVADSTHPLQTKLSLILTDFEPNGNKQGIPISEADNILRTAQNSPLKINFSGAEFYGHKGAIPIGPITHVFRTQDNGRDVIAAEAVIWNDIYEDIAEHLKVAFAEGIGTSWEIYFQDSEKDEQGTQWLHGCVFAGTCVVDTPAYGPNRTRVLAIAEKLNERADELLEKVNMAEQLETTDNVVTHPEGIVTPETEVEAPATAASDVEELRIDIGQLLDVLGTMYSGLYEMLDETIELEAQLVTTDMPSLAEQLTKLVTSVSKRFDSLREKASTAEQALSELQSEIDRANAAKAEAEKLEARKAALAELGLEIDTKKDFYMGMADDVFTQYVEDLRTVKGSPAKAEKTKQPIVPDPSVPSTTTTTIKELAALLRQ